MKNILLVAVKYLYIILLFFYFCESYAHKYEFNEIQVFGDSLSDQGYYDIVAIANSKNSVLYPQLLSDIFTGKNITSFRMYSNLAGTNHSFIGLTAKYNQYNVDNLPVIINEFIKYQSSNNNPNNLYIVWAGGNDLAQNSLTYVFNHDIISIVQPITQSIKNQINRLYDVNAKNVLVANMYNPAIGPLMVKNHLITFAVIDNVYSIILQLIKSKKEIASLFIDDFSALNNFLISKKRFKALLEANLLSSSDSFQRTQDNSFIGSGNDLDLVFDSVNRFSHIKLLDNLFKHILHLETKVINIFNQELENSLYALNKDIVFMDIAGLYKDIRNDAKKYGIGDIVMPTCSLGMISYEVNDLCKTGSKYYHDDAIYMFSDQIHPSAFMHQIIAQYMQSVFNAPVQLSSIIRQFINLNLNNQDYVFNQIFNHKYNKTTGSFISLVQISGNNNKIGSPYNYNSNNAFLSSLNTGFLFDVSQNLTLGSNVNLSYGNYKPYEQFKYKFNTQIIDFITQYTNNNWSIDTNFHIGKLGANNIFRTIPLGLGQQVQKANTKGYVYGINLNLTKDFKFNANLNFNPIAKIYIDKYHINGFQEKDNTSTTMKFANTDFIYKEFSLGLRSEYNNNNNVNLYAEIDINQPINQVPIKIKSALKSTKTSFTREIAAFNRRSLSILTGINSNINNNLNLSCSINFKIDDNKNKNLNYSLGMVYKF